MTHGIMKHSVVVGVVFAALMMSSVIGAPQKQDRIIGGVTAPSEAPHLAAIILKSSGNLICSGFIYSESVVITAASCVFGWSVKNIQITVGLFSQIVVGPNEANYNLVEIIFNPKYNKTSKANDIAILKLEQPIRLSSSISFINYDEVDEEESNSLVDIMGWGITKPNGTLVSIKLKLAKLSLNNIGESCEILNTETFPNRFNNEYMICTDAFDGAPCDMDQGSPLIQGDVVVGIYSFSNCNQVPAGTSVSVFTRLSAHFVFIKMNAGPMPSKTATTKAGPNNSKETPPNSKEKPNSREKTPPPNSKERMNSGEEVLD